MSRRKHEEGLVEGLVDIGVGVVGLGVMGVVAVGSAIFGKKPNAGDTIVEHGNAFFRGRYKKVSGKCFRCDGTGIYHGKRCRKCGGSGHYEHTTWHR